ncbi:MAG: hypothetical protein K1000chlam2_01383 [Chlamydiae bacterium]|nr:hypothetical protein [Chlamydiota bacterium]
MHLALETGQLLQKKQTGFVHDRDAISVYENILFAYALFRSRLSDCVLEGKSLVERLLKFERDGNFPVYLHEYPQTLDPYLGLRILPILFWINHDFSHVIGDLKQELQMCIFRIVKRAQSLDLPPWAAYRLDAFDGKIGSLPQTCMDWGEALISLQIAEKKGASIEETIAAACKLWHPALSLYIGPTMRRNQERHELALSLFDLFMCHFQKTHPKRAERPDPLFLRGALIRPLSFEPVFNAYPVPYVDFNPEAECPLFIAWENHTFVLAKKHMRVEGNAEGLILRLSDLEEMGENFFLDHQPDHDLRIYG